MLCGPSLYHGRTCNVVRLFLSSRPVIYPSSQRTGQETPTGSHIAKRNAKGQFKELDNVGRSLAADRRTKAKHAVKSGHGDQGDRKR